MSNHRYSKFWWQDWQGDSSLRSCGLAARGLWMELLCVAHSGTPVGHVTLNGRPATNRQLAAIVGSSEKEVARLIAELEDAGVFSRTATGEIFSRRMVRDADKSDEGAAHVAKRWGNGRATGPPNRGANRSPITNPITLYSESESEAPPRRSPVAGGPAPRASKSFRPPKNAFHEMARVFDAEMAQHATTIEGNAEEVADLEAFRRRLAGGVRG